MLHPEMTELDNHTPQTLKSKVDSAVNCIPPLWPLQSFVAVNPFLGLSGLNFLEASAWVSKVLHGEIYMDPEYYIEKLKGENISDAEFNKMQIRLLKTHDPVWAPNLSFPSLDSLVQYLEFMEKGEDNSRVLSYADFVDKVQNSQWKAIITEEISKWSSVYFDEGQSLWTMPWKEESLWKAWRNVSALDQNPEWLGIKDFRKLVKSLPEEPMDCIVRILDELHIPQFYQTYYLQRLLVSVSGWAGYIQYQRWGKENDPALLEFLAIRLVFDWALFKQTRDLDPIKILWNTYLSEWGQESSTDKLNRFALYLSQYILENRFQDSLIHKIKGNRTNLPKTQIRKTLQAVFCIDVRSEVYRRCLESESDEVETLGFAGFFGVSIEYFPMGKEKGINLCPVLLNPKVQVREGLKKGYSLTETQVLNSLKKQEIFIQAWDSFKSSAISCFSFVESIGISFLGPLIAKTFPQFKLKLVPKKKTPSFQPVFRSTEMENKGNNHETKGLVTSEEIESAAGALKNMGLTDYFAPIILLAGHGSVSANNPYAASLDCGACGGHAGDINAKVLVSMLNDPEVRKGLEEYEIFIPKDTHFIAGLHNTTTDDLELFDLDAVPATGLDSLKKIKTWIKSASQKARLKRIENFSISQEGISDPENWVNSNSLDWAQVRPEWGLAGNAAFIAAPRIRTQNLDLKGRVFLHNYNSERDLDNSVLELIMLAPMVVATWINLQYYGSTVNNELFGSGNKTIHNVVGKLGIWQGNGGDLQTGLPLQSLHDGKNWVHEPLRLNVFLEADRNFIEQKILTHSDLKNLILNRWIFIFSIDPQTGKIYRFIGENDWEEA